VVEKTLYERGMTRVRRLCLAPGETTPWHRDPFHRVSVVLSGNALAIEYQDQSPSDHVALTPGQVDWDEPMDRVHRAVNVGTAPYEEVTIFFRDLPGTAVERKAAPTAAKPASRPRP
jgi:quercetin dioxygenase-like cupin family protein